jgi:hypothetical protein
MPPLLLVTVSFWKELAQKKRNEKNRARREKKKTGEERGKDPWEPTKGEKGKPLQPPLSLKPWRSNVFASFGRLQLTRAERFVSLFDT